MKEDIVEFEDYDISVDLKEIDDMKKEEIEECRKKIEEIKKLLNNY